MEARIVLDQILERIHDSNLTVPEAPHSIGRIAEYRGKVYLALLHLEMERIPVAHDRGSGLHEKRHKKLRP
jgi:hypothetical protein